MSQSFETSIWTTVYRTLDPAIIQVIISTFADRGVRSYAARESVSRAMGVLGDMGEVEIKVPDIDLDKALATLLELGYMPLEKSEAVSPAK